MLTDRLLTQESKITMDHRLSVSGQHLNACREDISLKQAVIKLGYLAADQFDDWVKP
jgi:fumarate hydratase class II